MPAFLLYVSIFSTGTLFGAFWVTRRRENWLRDHQPYQPHVRGGA